MYLPIEAAAEAASRTVNLPARVEEDRDSGRRCCRP